MPRCGSIRGHCPGWTSGMHIPRAVGHRYTVAIGLGVSTTANLGEMPVRLGVEVHYMVIRPDTIPAPTWDFRFMVIPALPAGLIPILN